MSATTKKSFNHEKYKNPREIIYNNFNSLVFWKTIRTAPAFNLESGKCILCLAENLRLQTFTILQSYNPGQNMWQYAVNPMFFSLKCFPPPAPCYQCCLQLRNCSCNIDTGGKGGGGGDLIQKTILRSTATF